MFEELMIRYPALQVCREDIRVAAKSWVDCYEKGGKLLACGNGGSCADCGHIVGELMKGFLSKRPLCEEKLAQMHKRNPQLDLEKAKKLQMGLPAIALPDMTAVNTAFCNDVDPEMMYAQALMGLGCPGDILLCLSTSGNAVNVVNAAQVAKGLGLQVIALTGKDGGKLKDLADICIRVPETETFKVQELHLPVYHYLCANTEQHFFGED